MIGLLLALVSCSSGNGEQRFEDPGFLCRLPLEGPVDTGSSEASLALVTSHSSCRPLVSLTCELALVRGDIVASGLLVEGREMSNCVPTAAQSRVPCEPDIEDAATRIIVYGDVATEVVLLPACVE